MFIPSQNQTRPAMLPNARLLQRIEAARYLSIAPQTFDKLVDQGTMPKPIKIYGRRLAWDVRALDAAIDDLLQDDVDDNPKIQDDSWNDI